VANQRQTRSKVLPKSLAGRPTKCTPPSHMSDVEEDKPPFQSRFDTERVDSQHSDGGGKELAGTWTHRGQWAPVPCSSLEPQVGVLDTWEENENVFLTLP